MGYFDDVAGTKVSKRALKIKAGEHRFKILQVKMVKSAQYKTVFFVPEMELLESDNPEMKAGSQYSETYGLNHQMGPANIKKFAAAVCGKDATRDDVEDEIAEFWSEMRGMDMSFTEVLEDFVSEDNPLGELGLRISVTAMERESKEGREYVAVEWLPCTEDDFGDDEGEGGSQAAE